MTADDEQNLQEALADEILEFVATHDADVPTKLDGLTLALANFIYHSVGGPNHDPQALFMLLGKAYSKIGVWIEGWRDDDAEQPKLPLPEGRS